MKVLIAEDDAVSRRLLEASLSRWGYDAVVCSNGREALEALSREDSPCLAILDWMMPEVDGVEVCRRVRVRGEEPYVYIILLTARNDKEDLLLGIESGADDYLVKPFDPLELRARLRAGRRILDLQMQLIVSRETMREQATHDFLTGLWNHSSILDALRRELSRARRERIPLGVLMIDIDNFKVVNDAHGHAVGDEVLHDVGDRLRECVREYDYVGRYGGEEFVVVLPDCDVENGRNAAERMRQAIDSRLFRTTQGEVPVTVSVGLATSTPESDDAAILLRAADAALYRAKRLGRNRTELATPDDVLAETLLGSRDPAQA